MPPSSGNCESEEAEQPEGGVHRGKVAGLMNKREDQPGDRTGYASQAQHSRHDNAEGAPPRTATMARGRTDEASGPVAGNPGDHDDEP